MGGRNQTRKEKKISFTLKLKESYNAEIDPIGLPLAIGFNNRPFDERILEDGQFEKVIIHISDYESFNLKFRNRTQDIDTTKKLKVYPSKIKSKKKIIKVPNSIDQE